MKRPVALLTEIISPYRIPLFNALAARPEIDLRVIFLSETDASLRQWHIYRNEIRFPYRVLPSWRRRVGKYNVLLNRGVSSALQGAAPNAIVCGGYSYMASWQALFWARKRRVPFLLWSESNRQDARKRHLLVEFLKAQFLRRCSGFAVAGRSAREYIRDHNIDDSRIFTAPDAVDNELFAAAAARARRDAANCRKELALPERYFLFAGRLVPEKGIFDLLAAYAKLEARLREQVGLVFVGDGPFRRELERRSRRISPGVIKFAGFAQRDTLAEYYALAEALVMPTHSDPWGLVVNEGMACGLPVIVTEVAGCAADLVERNWNGQVVPCGNVPALAEAMEILGSNPEACRKMGINSLDRISKYTPEKWAAGISAALEAVGTRD
jgi:glycosyltransferase involved in cell wall biosynthesis